MALTLANGSTVLLDYLDGMPLITADGLLTLQEDITFSASNLSESNRIIFPVLRGSGWDDGSGGTPASAGWTLSGVDGYTSFFLNAADFSVNLKVNRGTIISFY